MTAARPGQTFQLDLDGKLINGRYIEVDRPRRLVMEWELQRSGDATPTLALIEITFTPTGDSTTVRVEFSGVSAEDEAFYQQLWERHLDRIAAALR